MNQSFLNDWLITKVSFFSNFWYEPIIFGKGERGVFALQRKTDPSNMLGGSITFGDDTAFTGNAETHTKSTVEVVPRGGAMKMSETLEIAAAPVKRSSGELFNEFTMMTSYMKSILFLASSISAVAFPPSRASSSHILIITVSSLYHI